jgi:flagellar biosynthesis protein FlhB
VYSLTDDPVEQVAVDSLYSQVHKSPVASLVATTKLVYNFILLCCFVIVIAITLYYYYYYYYYYRLALDKTAR